MHVKSLLGKPDIVLPKHNTIIFVNGCYWHGHQNCEDFKHPETNPAFWKSKIEETKRRDSKKYLN